MKRRKASRQRGSIIPLNDLTPNRNPRGGSGGPDKIVFGEPMPNGAGGEKPGDAGGGAVRERREKERK